MKKEMLFVIALCLVAWLVYALHRAPEGYQNRSGFHRK
jgi:hypothetical protein